MRFGNGTPIGWGYYDAIKDMWDEWQEEHVLN